MYFGFEMSVGLILWQKPICIYDDDVLNNQWRQQPNYQYIAEKGEI